MSRIKTRRHDPDAGPLDYTFDWQPWLEASYGATKITSATWTVPAGLTLVTSTIDATGRYATAVVDGGTVGESYVLICEVTSDDGMRDRRRLRLECTPL